MSYFSSFDISENYSFDYSPQLILKESLPSRSGLLLIGIEYKDPLLPDLSEVLINPINYSIKKDDIGFVVAFDQISAKTLSNYSEKDSQHAIYTKNMNYFRKNNTEKSTVAHIENLASKLDSRLKDWRIKKEKYLSKSKKISDLDFKNIEIPTIFNLYEDCSPKGIFVNHIIVRGSLTRFGRIALVLRTYSERPILLYSDNEPNPGEWHKIRDIFKNIFYVYGSPTKINHIVQLDPKKAFKILILSSSQNNFVMDSESIVFSRIISDFFGLKNFLTEMMEENNMKYISVNPKYENNDFFFWPYFVRGSIHFSSLSMSIVAKSIINKTWISFIRNLTKPTNSKKNANENLQQNSKINTLEITTESAKEFQYFGSLQYALMCNKPSVIAVAILKAETDDKEKKTTLLRKPFASKCSSPALKNPDISLNSHIFKVMENFYGSEFLMTNPSALMPLRNGDKILVIGNIRSESPDGYFMKTINSSFRLATPKTAKKISCGNEFEFLLPEYRKKTVSLIKERIVETLGTLNRVMRMIVKNQES